MFSHICIDYPLYSAVAFNWAMPKSIWEFWKLKKGRKVAIFGEFGRITGEKGRSLF